jgi:H+/Cl- antiporter ClcA
MYDRNGSTSEYCFIRGQKIGMTGMVILVSTATSITIPVVLMFCPLMKQYSLVLPFLLYRCSVH